MRKQFSFDNFAVAGERPGARRVEPPSAARNGMIFADTLSVMRLHRRRRSPAARSLVVRGGFFLVPAVDNP